MQIIIYTLASLSSLTMHKADYNSDFGLKQDSQTLP